MGTIYISTRSVRSDCKGSIMETADEIILTNEILVKPFEKVKPEEFVTVAMGVAGYLRDSWGREISVTLDSKAGQEAWVNVRDVWDLKSIWNNSARVRCRMVPASPLAQDAAGTDGHVSLNYDPHYPNRLQIYGNIRAQNDNMAEASGAAKQIARGLLAVK